MNSIVQSDNMPRLWIKRLVLFESSDKIESPLREILFYRGLNIVWGLELPDDAGSDDDHPITLSGHSVGKTTLCRLIRYCLGETTFGNQMAMERIKRTFHDGWVGMELVVDGKEWSVLKSIGALRHSKAAVSMPVAKLFDLTNEKNKYQDFVESIHKSMMSDLKTDTPPNNGKGYQWKHLLAWLTRDQEARFQSLHNWRSPRSGSDTPRFDKPKEHALYLIRLVLDLILKDELRAAKILAETEQNLKKHERRVTELQKKPEILLQDQELALEQLLDVEMGEVLNIDDTDLTSHIVLKRNNLNQAILGHQTTLKNIEQRISDKRAWLSRYDEEQRTIKNLMTITEEGTEHPKSEIFEDDTIQKLRALWGKDCMHGNISFYECSYVKDRMTELDKVVDLEKVREDKRVDVETEHRRRAFEQQQRNYQEITALINELREKLEKDIEEKQQVEQELMELRTQNYRINYHLGQLQSALDLIEGRIPNTELNRTLDTVEKLKQSIEQQRGELTRLQGAYKEREKAIGNIYDNLIKNALSNTYSGTLNMSQGELPFRIEEATGLSGEAVETLALVLADVAAMICSCNGIGHHPRFLVHDSPREADLDRHIYNRYLKSMFDLSEAYGGRESAPFQYIVTTTSSPPTEIHGTICLQLRASPNKEMLFRRLLKNPETQSELFEGSNNDLNN